MRRWLLTPLVAGLFAVSFWESWSALTDAANDAQIPHPGPWPASVDGFILACALLIVEARRTGHAKGAWWPRLGLVGATALSTSIQALYAPLEDWAWALHAWSPLAVLFSFECLVWLAFTEARPDWPPPQPPTKQPGEPVDAPADAPVRTRRQRALTSAELVKVEPLIAERKAAYGIARELGIPYPVVRQHMRDQGLVSTNGDRRT